MKRVLLLAGLFALARWRRARLDACDREHGYGAFADVAPVATT